MINDMVDEGYKKKKAGYVIAIDFDGTIVTHEYPFVGKPVKLAKEVIRMLLDNGHRCFLYTMRDGSELLDAIEYCQDNDLQMWGWNESPEQFSESPKQYATFYIDDAAVGCPLNYNHEISRRPFVDWTVVADYLTTYGLITHEQRESLTTKTE
jgi:hypothetical protein